MKGRRTDGRHEPGFLTTLARDRRGNTLAIMAAAMVPLVAFSGSAVDMARLYVVKARLQQACDAGVLAGRKAMTDVDPATPLDSAATSQAGKFFANNFHSGWYQNANAVFTPTKTVQGNSTVANAVNGTANVDVPMAVMQFFGLPTVTLTSTCQAVYDLADSDIMFVLDTTGSMSCYPSDPDNCATSPTPYVRSDNTTGYYDPEKPATTDGSGNPMYAKLESLRQAVLLFDTTMRQNADKSTHFRYGFVPYSSSVNIGYSLPSGTLQNTSWTYQSRQVNRDYNWNGAYKLANGTQVSGASSFTNTGVAQTSCVAQRTPATGYSLTGASWGNAGFYLAMNYTGTSWTAANGGTCKGTQQPVRAVWRHQPYTLDVSQWSTGAAVTNPSRLDGLTAKWRGCVEEVNTTAAASFNVNSLPHDLDPDFIPSSAAEKWRPEWPDAIWLRPSTATADVNDDQVTENAPGPYYWTDVTYRGTSPFDQGGGANCGAAAQRLTTMTAQQVQNYVYGTDFRPAGGTYHDVGMIWGTRMLSPNGVFASDTAAWAGRSAPSRSIVFMTDGAMAPQQTIYGQYGVEMLDQRADAGGNATTDYNNHVARFRIECDAAKKRGITIYVVALGTAITPDLTYCASPGQGFQATSTTQLTTAFKTIAQRIAMLRISQ